MESRLFTINKIEPPSPYGGMSVMTCVAMNNTNLYYYDLRKNHKQFIEGSTVLITYSDALIEEDRYIIGNDQLLLKTHEIFQIDQPKAVSKTKAIETLPAIPVKAEVVQNDPPLLPNQVRQALNTAAVALPGLAVAVIATPTVAAPVLAVGLCSAAVNELTKVR